MTDRDYAGPMVLADRDGGWVALTDRATLIDYAGTIDADGIVTLGDGTRWVLDSRDGAVRVLSADECEARGLDGSGRFALYVTDPYLGDHAWDHYEDAAHVPCSVCGGCESTHDHADDAPDYCSCHGA